MKRIFIFSTALLVGLTSLSLASEVLVARVEDAISPASARFMVRAIEQAKKDGAQCLVIEMDTPGGLDQSMRQVIKAIMASPVPVVVYVAPQGSRAASAGAFIAMSSHVAAMAPGTSIGAAHPVGGQGEDIKGTMGEKVENFTASFSESIARQRGRNVEWAVKAVRQSVSVAADEAARLKVVDLVARDLDAVLAHIDGRTIEVAGVKRIVHVKPVEVRVYEMRLSQRVLSVLADPNVAYLLMLGGLLGLYVEFTNPGVVFPGVAGGICLLLALTAMQVLPLNYGALALLGMGVALLVAEAFLPTFGVVGVGGLVAFVLGSLFLFDSGGEDVRVAWSLVLGAGGGLALFILTVGALVARRRNVGSRLGIEGMIGAVGTARGRLAPAGSVLVHGEYWSADADEAIEPGTPVEVTGVDGLRLHVRAARGR